MKTIDNLQTYFESGITRDYNWRRSQLLQLRRMLKEKEADFCKALYDDLGKSQTESFLTEINFLVAEINHALDHLEDWMNDHVVASPVFMLPAKSFVRYEPLGVVLVMGAWNYPVQLTLGPLIAAISAGNCVVIKAPRTAKASFELMRRLIPEYLDGKAFYTCDEKVSNSELLDRAWGKIFLTGSGRIGKIVMKAAAETLTPVTLELGGKSPAIFTKNANFPVGIKRMLQGKFINAGQTCVAPDYVILEKGNFDDFLSICDSVLHEFFGSDIKASLDYGRMINDKNYNRLKELINGHEIVFGGNFEDSTRYIEPTIVLNPDLNSDLMQEEIFGPILPIILVDDLDQGIALVNSMDKPLALYIFSEDATEVERVLNETSSGGVCVNECLYHLAVPELPFGGVGPSGMGNYHGRHGFLDFSNEKAVVNRQTGFDPVLRYPPFDKKRSNQVKYLVGLSLPDWMLKSKFISRIMNATGGIFLK